ncbi:MAG: HEPN domain-containing protein [Candidatus Thermoplasmatota archaeon]
MRKAAEQWFKRGNENLNDAKILLGHGGSYGDTCFLCQRAVEKFLKGFLVLNSKKYRLIHNLAELLKDCGEIDRSLLRFGDDCKKLTAYYVTSRYPLPYPVEHTKEEADEAVKIAEKIIKVIKRLAK